MNLRIAEVTAEDKLKIKAYGKKECVSSVGRGECVCVRWAAAPVGAAAVGVGCIDLRGARALGGGGRAAGTSPPLARHPRSPQPAAHRDCRRTLCRFAALYHTDATFDIQRATTFEQPQTASPAGIAPVLSFLNHSKLLYRRRFQLSSN